MGLQEPHNWNTAETWIKIISAVILAGLIPLAIMISRDRLRHYRRGLLLALENWMVGLQHHKPMPSFEAARIKYELTPRGNPDQQAMLYSVYARTRKTEALNFSISAALSDSDFRVLA